jgi:hypothetical protein
MQKIIFIYISLFISYIYSQCEYPQCTNMNGDCVDILIPSTRCEECNFRGYLTSESLCTCVSSDMIPNEACERPVSLGGNKTIDNTYSIASCGCHESFEIGFFKKGATETVWLGPYPNSTEIHLYGEENPPVCNECAAEVYGPKPNTQTQSDEQFGVYACNRYGGTDPNQEFLPVRLLGQVEYEEYRLVNWVLCAGHGQWNTDLNACDCAPEWTLRYSARNVSGDLVPICTQCSPLYGPKVPFDFYTYTEPPYCNVIWTPDTRTGKPSECSGNGVYQNGACNCFTNATHGFHALGPYSLTVDTIVAVSEQNYEIRSITYTVLTCIKCQPGYTFESGCKVRIPFVSASPTITPTVAPSVSPTTSAPTLSPTRSPTASPSVSPTVSPSVSPTISPTVSPSISPTVSPTVSPTTISPSVSPTRSPSRGPTLAPTVSPTVSPTTKSPTVSPTRSPSRGPTLAPTRSPSRGPTVSPTLSPSVSPTRSPSHGPTHSPTRSPSRAPTVSPTISPTVSPSISPTVSPTSSPSISPTVSPSVSPSIAPTVSPSVAPTASPTAFGSIVFYQLGSTSNGNLGSYATVQADCVTAAPSSVTHPCVTGKVFPILSYSPTQQVSDKPLELGFSPTSRVITENGDIIANTWDDAFSTGLVDSLENLGVMNTFFWTGTNADGTVSGSTCIQWTDGSISFNGAQGSRTATDTKWVSDASQLCLASFYDILCACVTESSANPTLAPTVSPTLSPSISPTESASPTVSPTVSPTSTPTTSPMAIEYLNFDTDVSSGNITIGISDGSPYNRILTGLSSNDKGLKPSFQKGDLNGDGINDICVAPFRGGGVITRIFYCIYGTEDVTERIFAADTDITDSSIGFKITTNHYLIASIFTMVDINNDGYSDILLPNGGDLYVIYGGTNLVDIDITTDLDGTNGFKIDLSSYNTLFVVFPLQAAGIGDINNDGYQDFAIGDYNADSNGLSRVGVSFQVFGGDDINGGAASVEWRTDMLYQGKGFEINGTAASDVWGYPKVAGDINGDGYDDFFITGSFIDGIYVIYGNETSVFTQPDTRSVAYDNLPYRWFRIYGGGTFCTDLGSNTAMGGFDFDGDGNLDFGTTCRTTFGNRYVILGLSSYDWGASYLAGTDMDYYGISGYTGVEIGFYFSSDLTKNDEVDLITSDQGFDYATSNNQGVVDIFYNPNTPGSSFVLNSVVARSAFTASGKLSIYTEYPYTVTNAQISRFASTVVYDVNNDGHDDIFTGATDYYSNKGNVYIIYTTTDPTSSPTESPAS